VAELDALNEIVDEIHDAGGTLLVISPQTQEHSKALIDQHDLKFPILQDAGLRVAEQFNLAFELPDDLIEVYSGFGINLPDANGEDAWRLPMPARYIVDQSGTIRDAEVNPDYTQRPEPTDTLASFRQIAAND